MSDRNQERAEGLAPPPVSSEALESSADPGWYQASETSPHWWWWDGTRWTEHKMADPAGEDILSAVEAILPMVDVLGERVAVMQKDIGFIANVLRVFVVLWVLGFIFFVVAFVA